MNRGGQDTRCRGFTIVETLIVLVVTSSLLVSTILLLGGRQNKTDFLVGSRQLRQELQTQMSQVVSGRYTKTNSIQCTRDGATGAPKIVIGAADSQGKSSDCIFIGTAILLGAAQAEAEASPNHTYTSYPLAGLRVNSATLEEASSINEAKPTAVYVGGSGVSRYKNGLEYYGAKGTIGSITTFLPASAPFVVYAVVSLNGNSSINQSVSAPQIDLYPPAIVPAWGSGTNDEDNLNNSRPTDPARLYEQVELCFASGGTNQSVLYTLGSAANGSQVSMDIKNGGTCGW
ncbi:type II secretion system protein [Candidatus Saccharibacteria bacterium]|nr:type II secretion system protein [Candidatus Saccharibacteria bacterium]